MNEKFTSLICIVLSFLFVVMVGIVDFYTNSEIAFSLFYLLAIILSTSFYVINIRLAVGLFSALSWLIADSLTHKYYSAAIIGYGNAIVRLVFFVAIAYLLPALKELVKEKIFARSDALTGVANRRYFFSTVSKRTRSFSVLSTSFNTNLYR